MKVDGADRDVEKVCRAARTLFLLRGTCLFDLFVSQTGNMEAVTRLLEENLDENGQPLAAEEGKRGSLTGKHCSDPRAWMNEGLCTRLKFCCCYFR